MRGYCARVARVKCGVERTLSPRSRTGLKVPPAGGAIRTSPGSGCGAVEETRPRDAVMTPHHLREERRHLDVHLCLLCTQPFLGQKARPPWSSRLVCWGGWSTQCRPGLRGVEGLTRAAQCGTIAPCAGTHHRAPRRCAWILTRFCMFWGTLATYPLQRPPVSPRTGRTAQCSLESPPLTPRRPRNNLDVSAND